jgi:hypothetical protein
MKAKYTIVLIALGFCLDFVGSLCKMAHYPNANTIFLMATVVKVTGVLWLTFKIISYTGFKKFMEQ